MKRQRGVIIAFSALTATMLALLVRAFVGALRLPTPARAAPVLAPALDAPRHFLTLPGFGRVAYYADPSGAGRPLLLLPSVNAAASAYEMRPLFGAYRGRRPVYVLEWPGFGSSDRPDVPYDPALMVRALDALLDVIGEADVVALSQAGEFAARAALEDARIRSLALISPTGFSEKPAPSREQSRRLYGTLRQPLIAGPFYWLLTRRSVIRAFLRRSFVGAPDAGLVAYSTRSTRQPGAVHAPLAFVAGLLRTPDACGELYAALRQPTLLLYDRDGYVTFERVPELVASRPNVTATRLAPSLGLPQFEVLPALQRALDDFWAGPSA